MGSSKGHNKQRQSLFPHWSGRAPCLPLPEFSNQGSRLELLSWSQQQIWFIVLPGCGDETQSCLTGTPVQHQEWAAHLVPFATSWPWFFLSLHLCFSNAGSSQINNPPLMTCSPLAPVLLHLHSDLGYLDNPSLYGITDTVTLGLVACCDFSPWNVPSSPFQFSLQSISFSNSSLSTCGTKPPSQYYL